VDWKNISVDGKNIFVDFKHNSSCGLKEYH
jgi:hypothetical protein